MLSLRLRRTIYAGFIILFLITAPMLVLYTAGYRYNFKRGAVQKVGSLSVKTLPTNAEIYLDNILQTGSRPSDTLRINNLLPGKYQVAVKLDNYYSWQKQLEVESNVNTFINQAVLFKQTKPENIIREKITQTLGSPDNKRIAYLSADQIKIFNLSNSQDTILEKKSTAAEIVSWSPDGNNLLVKNKDSRLAVYNIDNPTQPLYLNSLIPLDLTDARWDADVSYLLYAFINNRFYQINILTRNYREIYSFPKTAKELYGPDFYYHNNEIYYTHNTSDGLYLEKINLDEVNVNKKITRLLKLSSGESFAFHPNPNGTICLLDKQKQKLYLVDGSFNGVLLEAEAKGFDWSADGKNLAHYSDFEIWIYNTDANKDELITRYGQTVQKVINLPKFPYLSYLVNGSLFLTELDNRDARNVIDLIDGQEISDFFVDAKAKNIFFAGQIGNEEGMFKINIQE